MPEPEITTTPQITSSQEPTDNLTPQIDSNIKDALNKYNEATAKYEQAEKRYSELKEEVKESKRDFLIIFGLFASFVTFISVEIQIFKTVNNFWLLLGLSAFLLSSILLFALMLVNLTKGKNTWDDYKTPAFYIPLALFIFALILFGINLATTPRDTNTSIHICLNQNC